MSRTLAGIVCVRNGDTLDYCWRESVLSLLPICDEIILCDCDSDDGTKLERFAAVDSKIRVLNFPWTNPVGSNTWWPEFQNYARAQAKSEMCFFLDADEVLADQYYDEVRAAADAGEVLLCRRRNFWRDSFHLIPEGKCVGHEVIRLVPQNLWVPSDYPDPQGRDKETLTRARKCGVEIMHYGFIRKREAFFRKTAEVEKIWTGSRDTRLADAEKFDGDWSTMPGVTGWENDLVEYRGTHPEVIHRWLRERGYRTELTLSDFAVPTWTEPETLAYCAKIASESRFMIECGSYMGASARAMLLANPKLHLWCVDTFGVFGTQQIVEMFLHHWIKRNQCEIIRGDSRKGAEVCSHMAGKIDAIWVDDGHSEEDLRRDIDSLLPLLKPGGILFGHDWDGENDVAIGVKSRIPFEKLTFPVPRVWHYQKPLWDSKDAAGKLDEFKHLLIEGVL
jgi:predicted O-methyltransferase YrrM